jgi:hypothetical protein
MMQVKSFTRSSFMKKAINMKPLVKLCCFPKGLTRRLPDVVDRTLNGLK